MFDMPKIDRPFVERAGWLCWKLAQDLDISFIQSAGIVGNLAYESGQFKELQEIKPTSGRGGYGWAQWTGPRRIAFESWCAARDLSPSSDEANYGFLVYELTSPAMQAHSLDRLKQTTSVETATFTFGYHFEAPRGTTPTHLPAMEQRLAYAKQALGAAIGLMVDKEPPKQSTELSTEEKPTVQTPILGPKTQPQQPMSSGTATAVAGGTSAMLAAVLIWATTWPIKPLDPGTALALAGLIVQIVGLFVHYRASGAPPDAQN